MYDFNNMNFLKMVLEGIEGVFIDVGANIGSYSLIMSEIKGIQVISIEPHPDTYSRLCNNIKLNDRPNVIPLNIAVSDQNTVLTLMISSLTSTQNKIVDHDIPAENTITVLGKTLDTLCTELSIIPTVVKIDVEGHEENVLNGFSKKIGSVQLMVIENGDNRKIINIMEQFGFIGPLYVHFKSRKLSRIPHRSNEDPLYLRESLKNKLDQFCFIFEN
jgi:FkbM family methyltransferase